MNSYPYNMPPYVDATNTPDSRSMFDFTDSVDPADNSMVTDNPNVTGNRFPFTGLTTPALNSQITT